VPDQLISLRPTETWWCKKGFWICRVTYSYSQYSFYSYMPAAGTIIVPHTWPLPTPMSVVDIKTSSTLTLDNITIKSCVPPHANQDSVLSLLFLIQLKK